MKYLSKIDPKVCFIKNLYRAVKANLVRGRRYRGEGDIQPPLRKRNQQALQRIDHAVLTDTEGTSSLRYTIPRSALSLQN